MDPKLVSGERNIFIFFLITGLLVAAGVVASFISDGALSCGPDCNVAKSLSGPSRFNVKPTAMVFDKYVNTNGASAFSCRVPAGSNIYCDPAMTESTYTSSETEVQEYPVDGKLTKYFSSYLVNPPAVPKLPANALISKMFNQKTNIGTESEEVTARDGTVTRNTITTNANTTTITGAPRSGLKGRDTSANYTTFDETGRTLNAVWETYSYAGNSQKMLMVKGDYERIYEVTLSVLAWRWRLASLQDGNSQFSPHQFIEDRTNQFDCSQITIRGVQATQLPGFNGGCKVVITVSNVNRTAYFDVTPSVSADRYRFDVGVSSIRDIGGATGDVTAN